MKITKRERGILIFVITMFVLGINYLLIVPLLRNWHDTDLQLKNRARTLDDMRATIQHQDEWSKEYNELKRGLGQQTVQFQYTSDVVKKIQEVAAIPAFKSTRRAR